MYYIQELESLIGDIELSKEQRNVFLRFSDENVNFPLTPKSSEELLKDDNLLIVFRKLKSKGLYMRYAKMLKKHANSCLDDFFKKMDEEL